VIVMVVAGREQEINVRRGYSPVKLKIGHPALSISLISKLPAGSMVGTRRIRLMW
jgi:hypothetical protein